MVNGQLSMVSSSTHQLFNFYFIYSRIDDHQICLMKKAFLFAGIGLILAVCVKAQGSSSLKKDTSRFKFTVEKADDWTNLFYRNSGWFGGDGIFSIPLSGVDKNNNEGNDSTLLIFGDTYWRSKGWETLTR